MLSKIHLDELDMMIAAELDINARQTTRDLGTRLGVSSSTISIRLRRMVDSGAIIFAVLCNPRTLGFQNMMVFGLRTTPGKSADVAGYLSECKSVQTVSWTAGRYDLLIYAAFHDNRELRNWITCLPDITTAEGFTMLQVVRNSYIHPPDKRDSQAALTPLGSLDELDITLMKELESSPRETIGNLGKKTGLGRKKIATRIKKLLDQRAISIVSMINPEALGFALRVFVFLKVEVDKIVPISRSMANHKRIGWVSIISGCYDVMLHAGFSDPEELSYFVGENLRCIPGIIEYEILINPGPQHFRWRLLS